MIIPSFKRISVTRLLIAPHFNGNCSAKKITSKLKICFIHIVVMFFSISSFAQSSSDMSWTKNVGSRKFPASKTIFRVNDFGSVSDTSVVCTKVIQAAIDACAKKGGGVVIFNPGVYLMGSVFLKSNVHLKIDKGVLIKGSQNFDDYPEIDTRIAGIEMKWPAALINVINQENVAVSGEGKINTRGKFCWDKYWAMRKIYEPKGLRWVVDYDAKRVRTFLVQSSEDVTLKGLTFSNAGFWTVQILYSKYITVDGITVRNNEDGKGPSTDGVDVDSSSWVLIENCDIRLEGEEIMHLQDLQTHRSSRLIKWMALYYGRSTRIYWKKTWTGILEPQAKQGPLQGGKALKEYAGRK